MSDSTNDDCVRSTLMLRDSATRQRHTSFERTRDKKVAKIGRRFNKNPSTSTRDCPGALCSAAFRERPRCSVRQDTIRRQLSRSPLPRDSLRCPAPNRVLTGVERSHDPKRRPSRPASALRRRLRSRKREGVRLSVQDVGVGLAPHVVDKLFPSARRRRADCRGLDGYAASESEAPRHGDQGVWPSTWLHGGYMTNARHQQRITGG